MTRGRGGAGVCVRGGWQRNGHPAAPIPRHIRCEITIRQHAGNGSREGNHLSVTLTENQAAHLREKHIAELVTLMPDGSPQITPVWIDTDGTHVLVNTAAGRLKTRNIERDPRVAVSVVDPASPYERVLNIRGRVIDITPEGADDHIDSLAKKYLGVDSYPGRDPAEQRLILTIEADHASGGG